MVPTLRKGSGKRRRGTFKQEYIRHERNSVFFVKVIGFAKKHMRDKLRSGYQQLSGELSVILVGS
jgi:hypothetical protein